MLAFLSVVLAYKDISRGTADFLFWMALIVGILWGIAEIFKD